MTKETIYCDCTEKTNPRINLCGSCKHWCFYNCSKHGLENLSDHYLCKDQECAFCGKKGKYIERLDILPQLKQSNI